MRRGLKIALALIAAGLAIMLVGLLIGLFQNALFSGAKLVQQLGDTVIITDDTAIGGEDEYPYDGGPQCTVPPGDDPSWADEMPDAPVEWPEESGQ